MDISVSPFFYFSSAYFWQITVFNNDNNNNNNTNANVYGAVIMAQPLREFTWLIQQLGFDISWQQWSLLNRFHTKQWHCGACRKKWRLTDTDLCYCGKTKTMSHIVESCPLTKLNGDLSRLHSADEDSVSWLTNYGSWHAYEKIWWMQNGAKQPPNLRLS